MKKNIALQKIAFAIILTVLSAFLNAQNSFPTENAIWNETGTGFHERLLGLLGQTTINDTLYSNLYEFSDTLLLQENICEIIGWLRSEGEKVWFRPYSSLPEILLYDFGADVGDTVWHNGTIRSDIDFSNSYSIITSIETDGDGRKVYGTNYYYFETYVHTRVWIEGIGCEHGLLMSITQLPISDDIFNYRLNCFKHNEEVKYISNYCNKCFHCSHSSIDVLEFGDIAIFPNPAKDLVNIKAPININVKSIYIYSLNGKLVDRKNYSFNAGQLNISDLKRASYIIKIETDKGNFNKLIVKK